MGKKLNKYEQSIVDNATWFLSKETKPGFIDVDGDEFYGVRGDATLVGHSVTVRTYAYLLTGNEKYKASAMRSLKWLTERQDKRGGWSSDAVFTLDAAQCVFEGYNTFQTATGDKQFNETLVRAAKRMVEGTISPKGRLLLPNIIEIGEYAHFSLLAWKSTGDAFFRKSAENILSAIYKNFDKSVGYWRPYDQASVRSDFFTKFFRPFIWYSANTLPLKGKIAVRIADKIGPFVVRKSIPQYSMNMMDAEVLLDTLDGSCEFPKMREQTEQAINWVCKNCQGPFSGSLVESIHLPKSDQVYPLKIINDCEMAALWPSACLLLAYCGMNDPKYKNAAKETADWIVSVQDKSGGFNNFQRSDGSFYPLQSGNVNFYASMALWIYNEVYLDGEHKLFTKQKTAW